MNTIETVYALSSNHLKIQRIRESLGHSYNYKTGSLVDDSEESLIQLEYNSKLNDYRYPLYIAQGKARCGIEKIKNSFLPGYLIITDSVVASDNNGKYEIYNKPDSKNQAIDMLRGLLDVGNIFSLSGVAIGHTRVNNTYYCAGMGLRIPLKKDLCISDITKFVEANWQEISKSAGAVSMFGSGKQLVDIEGEATGYRFDFTEEIKEFKRVPVEEVYKTDDSPMRKLISGTYPDITQDLMEQMRQRALNI
jgi:predicted house-cleaning NTP pyrophosphatase (Maf/HAM1 superfamily)